MHSGIRVCPSPADEEILALLLSGAAEAQQQQQQQQQSSELHPAKRPRVSNAASGARGPVGLGAFPASEPRAVLGGGKPEPLLGGEYAPETAQHSGLQPGAAAPPHHSPAAAPQPQLRPPAPAPGNGRFVPPRRCIPTPAAVQVQPSTDGTGQPQRHSAPSPPRTELDLRFASSPLGQQPGRHVLVPDAFASCAQYRACWTAALQEELQIRRFVHTQP
jgi:hypothetical protein